MVVTSQLEDAQKRGVVRFVVYGDPIPKARPRLGKERVYTPDRTKDQEQRIALVYKSIYRSFSFGKGVPLRMVVDMFLKIPKSAKKAEREAMIAGEIRPVKRILDADNGEKLAADSLNGIAYHDDAQIVEMTGRKFYSETPRTEIFIAAIGVGDEE